MTNLQYTVLPLTNDPYQVFTLDTTIDGEPFRARFEVRQLHPGDTVAVRLPGLRCRGVIRERALEMDTGGEDWRCEVVTQILT